MTRNGWTTSTSPCSSTRPPTSSRWSTRSVSEPLGWCFYGTSCHEEHSCFTRFLAEFWSGELSERWAAIIEEFRTPETRYPWRELIYPRFPELFVSAYAATKDLAESFMKFVLRPELPEPDAYDGGAKVRWLWQQPALVAPRDQLRTLR